MSAGENDPWGGTHRDAGKELRSATLYASDASKAPPQSDGPNYVADKALVDVLRSDSRMAEPSMNAYEALALGHHQSLVVRMHIKQACTHYLILFPPIR